VIVSTETALIDVLIVEIGERVGADIRLDLDPKVTRLTAGGNP